VIANDTGQMSIFVALIFQVLFVFFAMVINVGLLVHDKINLQNAVDLAAFYGAQKQAETLNEIAHINYQIRQDYKLLTWRYRVMGTLGRQGTTNPPSESTLPPARKSNAGSLSDKAWVNPDYGQEPASVCISHEMWKEMVEKSDEAENYCFRPYNSTIPKIPDVVVIAPFVPGISASVAFTKFAQDQQRLSCKNAGPRNWMFTMQMIFGYKLGISVHKQLIWELRRNLIAAEPLDRFSQSVKEGAMKTLEKNLTGANKDGFQKESFRMINGLADANCNRDDDGQFVMPEILTAPGLIYTAYKCDDGTTPFMVEHSIYSDLDPEQVAKFDTDGLYRNLANGEPEATSEFHSTLGFEKNPWCMGYVGVRAETKTHKPFSPFGSSITLEARAFAQPFGGRVGPWYKSNWTRGAATSDSGERVDPLTSPRMAADGSIDSGTPGSRAPNYSRYPGDTLGLTSEISLGAQNSIIRSYAPPKPKAQRLSLDWYAKFGSIPTTGDLMAGSSDPTLPLRRAELSSVVPDLFDATYYSIDPEYTLNYINNPERFANAKPIFGQKVVQIPDAGGNLQANISSNIASQIAQSLSGGFDTTVLSKLYYVIRNWSHLLTGWVAQTALNYSFPAESFGKCQEFADPSVMIPGKCSAGGRTGYSVRLISGAHLSAETWNVGGEGGSAGAILNPPPADF
jgi:hypothetical protein